jgi:hypothetical protein
MARVIFPGKDIVHAVHNPGDRRVLLGVPAFFLWKLVNALRSRSNHG